MSKQVKFTNYIRLLLSIRLIFLMINHFSAVYWDASGRGAASCSRSRSNSSINSSSSLRWTGKRGEEEPEMRISCAQSDLITHKVNQLIDINGNKMGRSLSKSD